MRLRLILLGILLLYAATCVTAIDWGLPSARSDAYLFGSDEPWSGEKIYRLAGGWGFGDRQVAADVDLDPIQPTELPINLTATPEGVASIYLRYRLYSHQPDEMIVLRSLGGMRPKSLQLDPKLYQYGGLFIYPVGALVALCGQLGLVTVTSDVVYYLDHPDEFGALYIVARAYAASWGLLGVLVVYGIGRRLGTEGTGCVAALLFALMPVVVCMSHEGKPHLPGAVLMLLAVWLAMRCIEDARSVGDTQGPTGMLARVTTGRRAWWLLCVICGAAVGMVLSSAPILILIPLVAVLRRGSRLTRKPKPTPLAVESLVGLAVACGAYAATNPYVPFNLLFNPSVLASNFGNSVAMYELGRAGAGLRRMLELTVEGATLPIVGLGLAAAVVAVLRRLSASWPLMVAGGAVAVQFILLGAGKPAEYGRFGVFPAAALAIGAACVLVRRWTRLREPVNWIPAWLVVLVVGYLGWQYQYNFMVDSFLADSGAHHSRQQAAERAGLADGRIHSFAVVAEPAPYCCPPANFARTEVWLLPHPDAHQRENYGRLIYTVDQPRRSWRLGDPGAALMGTYRRVVDVYQGHALWDLYSIDRLPITPISWANKPVAVQLWNYDSPGG
ncbi:MAG: glycosyltransferase family 39 protein [Planctomycetes bacterium]|nr:glycosyltransferase family 39 protein [Planctomycetota bacterium]